MSNAQLLVEQLLPAECNLIEESSQDGKTLWLNGTMMMAVQKNRNGRVYPVNEIQNAVQAAKQRIQENRALVGELDHPQTLTINLDRVSHAITEIDMAGHNAVGKAKILSTPMGNIARELINSGVALGVSSRGAGQVNEQGYVSGYQFVTIDLVFQPSAQLAMPSAVYEGLDMYKRGSQITDLASAMRYDQTAQKYFKQEIMKWLNTGLFSKRK